MPDLKYSRQREEIKACLFSRKDHPTAEMIYQDLRLEDPRLSLGTVYRNLALLAKRGEIRKISVGNEPDRFDGDTSVHFHFICRSCHCVSDLRPAQADRILAWAAEGTDGQVESIMLNVYGVCRNCLDGQEKAT